GTGTWRIHLLEGNRTAGLEATRRQEELAEVFAEAWGRGQSWRVAIQKGLSLLPEKRKAAAALSLGNALSSIGAELEGFTDAAVK
ncbi:hypothetical protein QN226_20085, partial [Sinorhizobium sp. 6-117]|nr:hypothetical protein [Sinorhizobium sp. 6-117]